MSSTIYLDGHASTPLAPEAKEAMFAAWSQPGNPSSPHFAGVRAAELVEDARTQAADLLGCSAAEIIFTSGATEANNIAILGSARNAIHRGTSRRRILVSAIEHKSVLAAAMALRTDGFEIQEIPVDRSGLVDPGVLASMLSNETLLVSVSAANGEIGVVQRLDTIVAAAHSVGALVHSDLAQLAGKLPIGVSELDLDYASVSAHKMYGPVGIGALFMSAVAPSLAPVSFGGGQERSIRPGTVAAPLAAGFGTAARIARRQMYEDGEHARALAAAFLDELSRRQVQWRLNGDKVLRLPGSLSLQIAGIDAESIVDRVSDRLAISTGSACQSGEIQPSHVLKAINLDEHQKRSTLRLFFNRYNKEDEARGAAEQIARAFHKERLATGGIIQ